VERLHEKNWKEVEKYLEKKDLILLPIGSTEQHGTHLPLMTDTANALMLAEELSKEREIMTAPPIWYGWSPQHLAFPGSITTRPETLSNLLKPGFPHHLVPAGEVFIMVLIMLYPPALRLKLPVRVK